MQLRETPTNDGSISFVPTTNCNEVPGGADIRLILISDTHEQHEALGTLPEGDVLIHAGDYTYTGSKAAKAKFLDWFYSQPHKQKIFVAGNHDFKEPKAPSSVSMDGTTTHYLFDSEIEIEGVKFWGSPYTPRFGDWAFMYDREEGLHLWDKIPTGTDVLITHGPALGFRDRVAGYREQVGCLGLRNAIMEIKPKLHIFGHIHGSYGEETFNGTHFVNASICNEAYKPVNEPIVVDL